MADALVETLQADGRREVLRQIAGALASPSVSLPPYPPAIPCAVLWGDADEIAAPPDRSMPGLRVIRNVGHLPHIEAVADVIAAFRDLQDRTAGAP
jgi:pimeloyl-ACP methyl ester carboxylesterase